MRAFSQPRLRTIVSLGSIIFALLALAAVVVFDSAPVSAQSGSGIMSPGTAAVTGFSGVPNYPTEDTIDSRGPSVRVVPLPSGPDGLDDVTKPFTVTARDVGQVFGVALDDRPQPDIFVAATSAYGLAIYQPGAGRLERGATGAQYTPNLFGPPDQGGGPGSIWRIDGATGQVSLFANVTFNGIQNTPASLGGLAYDPRTQQLFVADRATGMIHRFGMDGSDRGVFDHGVDGRGEAGLPTIPFYPATLANIASPSFDSQNPHSWGFAPWPRRIFAVAIRGWRLYYAVADGPQVWSVGINSDGSFAHDAHLELASPALRPGSEISQIAFDGHPHLYVAERAMPAGAQDFRDVADGGQERVLRFSPKNYGDPTPGYWSRPGDQYATGMFPQFENADGGVDIKCGSTVWATGERLLDPGSAAPGTFPRIDGLQGTDANLVEPANMPPTQSRYVNYYDGQADTGSRGHMGAIAIWNMCNGGYVPPAPPPAPPPEQTGYGCPPGLVEFNGGCFVPPACPPDSEFRQGYCVFRGCPDDFIRLHGACVRPPRECHYGEVFIDDRCVPIGCPRGLERTGEGWCHCPDDLQFRDGRCVPVSCPRDEEFRDGRCIPIRCPDDEEFRDGRCVPIGCPRNEVYRDGRCVPIGCPRNEVYRDGRCVPIGCPRNEVYRDGRCVPIGCPRDEVYRDGRCVPTGGGCPQGERINSDGICVPVGGGCPRDEVYRDGRCVPTGGGCPQGERINSDGICVPVGGGCPRDEVYRDGRCVPMGGGCPQGERINSDGICVPVGGGCPRGEVLNSDGRCVSEGGGCPRGEVYRDGRCTSEGGGCPRGEVLNSDGRCVSEGGGCPRGEVYRDGRCTSEGGGCPRGEVLNSDGHCVSEGGGCPRGEVYRDGMCQSLGNGGNGRNGDTVTPGTFNERGRYNGNQGGGSNVHTFSRGENPGSSGEGNYNTGQGLGTQNTRTFKNERDLHGQNNSGGANNTRHCPNGEYEGRCRPER